MPRLHGFGAFDEPRFGFARHMRFELGAHFDVVIVQPAAFFFGEQRGIDQPRVNRAERYRFKAKVVAKLGFLRLGNRLGND